ncbi:DUF6415 family natural product biosynthesis protein [Streptomyces sp. NPDC002676]
MNATVKRGNDTGLVDIATMRETVALLLGPDEGPETLPLASRELDTLTAMLRGHLGLLIPEVEAKAGRLHKDSVPRYCALACVGEARGKLSARAGAGPHGAAAYARKLARTLRALCDHFEALAGQGVCVACDRPMRATDETVDYDRVSNSGGALTSRIHAACAEHPRPAF